MRSIVFILISACMAGCISGAVTKPAAKSDKPYLGVLQALKSSDRVTPAMPEVHPVTAMYNREGIIPPQCYTRTEGRFNPCYVCHQDAIPNRENVMNDGDLQIAYSFSDKGMRNHWLNLFEDRRQKIAHISDEEILAWVNQDNYSELAVRLKEAGFKGWIPDLKNLHLGKEAFAEDGFAKDGSHWVAFNFKPLPSTFWPTNGSTDDVMIRLSEPYRTDNNGQYSIDVYRANIAIVEANIKGLSAISSLPVDESRVGKDLNQDGKLSVIHRISDVANYVGAASGYFIDTHLYPEGVEFLHTVRYLGIDGQEIRGSTRMKEVRYMRKWNAFSKPVYTREYQLEAYEKEAGNLPGYTHLGGHGLDNGIGWSVAGFIEGRDGRLRANTFEENFFCMGCHGSVGSTIDKTFSFTRKVDGAEGWGYIDLKAMQDAPNMGETEGEYLTYFQRVGGGDEFRSNSEMFEKWFLEDGQVNLEKVRSTENIYQIITPSVQRALTLNKAYKIIVDDQDFMFGRDATVKPPLNVYESIDNKESPTLPKHLKYAWDIRLNWSSNREPGSEN